MPALALASLTRSYGPRRGVADLSLSVPEGALFGFLGPNGAGKTTTIRVLLGLLRPTSGRASIFGLDCWRDTRRIKAEVGAISGDFRFYPWMTGRDALAIFGAARRRDLRRPGRDLAERFALDLSVRARAMSRGTRQKLGLVLALAHNPRLLILDEPTTALDPLMQDQCRALLRERAAAGATVFFSSHSLAEVESLCHRVAIVREGRLVADQSLDELRRQAGREVTIRWRDSAGDAAPPSFLHLRERTASEWSGALVGPVDGLIEFLHGKPVADLSVSPPDLESLFQRYYEGK